MKLTIDATDDSGGKLLNVVVSSPPDAAGAPQPISVVLTAPDLAKVIAAQARLMSLAALLPKKSGK